MSAADNKDSRFLITSGILLSQPLALAFEISGALILQQLHWWVTGSKNQRDGHTWIYSSYEEWCKRITVFGEKTIRNKLKELEDLKIITTGNFNKHRYDRTRWYRIDYEVLVLELQKRLPDFQVLPESSGKFFQIHLEPVTGPIPKNNTKKETEISLATTTSSQGESSSADIITEPPMAKTISSATVILNNLKGKVPPEKTPNTTASAQALWRSLVPAHHPSVGMLPEFTVQKKGQIANIVKALFAMGTPSDKVLRLVIPEWIAFTKFVAAQTGLKNTPDVPQVGFVLKYVSEAASFYTQRKSTLAGAVKLTAPKKIKKLNWAQSSPPSIQLDEPVKAEKEEPASVEDVLAWKPAKKE